MFNSLKLLPCGRIIFYNSKCSVPEKGSFLTDSREVAIDSEPEPGSLPLPGSSPSYLGLSHVVISDNVSTGYKRARKGTKGITSHGRNQIRAGCHWLEERFGKRNLTFLTATLPDQAMLLCTPHTWSEVVNRFLKSLRYHLTNVGLCPEIVGCTEIQSSRLLKTDRTPPLHLHLLFQGRQPYGHWGIDKREYQRLWQQACLSVWPVSVDFGSSCRSESIYRSGVAYMSKYLSKGGKVLEQCNPELLPSAWYTISSHLKGIIKATISSCRNYLARTLYEQIRDSDILTWARDIYSVVHGDGSQYLLCWMGQIRDRSIYWKLKKQIDFCISVNTEAENKLFSFSL